MANSKQIVYLSQSQYAELIANDTITVDGVTVTYDENDIYVTPQAEPVTDVRMNGNSIAVNGVADIPMAGNNTLGLVRVRNTQSFGVKIDSAGNLDVRSASSEQIKNGTANYIAITPTVQDQSVFYGLAKASGDTTQSSSSNFVGTYTPEAKGAIQQMLGVSDLIAPAENNLVASQAYKVGEVFTANGKLYKATAAIAADAAIIPAVEGEEIAGANCEETSVGEGFVKFTDVANSTTPGVVRINGYGLSIGTTGNIKDMLYISYAGEQAAKLGISYYNPIVPHFQDHSVFYGLSKVAGVDLANETVTLGTYPETSKAAIRSMIGAENGDDIVKVQDTEPTTAATKIWLPETAPASVTVPTVAEMETALAGKVGDVQVNGTSVVSNGVANVSVASQSNFGVVKGYGLRGIGVDSAGNIYVMPAGNNDIKQSGSTYAVITATNSYVASFYGLAKASGDTTQSASSNAVGTYTDNAKASIKAMLGIQDGSTGTVDVTGTTPTITAVENTRYVCGEVTSLSFTPPASGISIVRFTSGSTVTVLTIPSTVKFPEWFDPTSLETNTIYEICITDGVYGAVMSWAL